MLCAHCGAEVDVGRVSAVGLACCPGCQRYLDLDPLLPPRPAPPPPEEVAVPPPPRPPGRSAPLLMRRDAPFPMPEHATVEDRPEHLVLRIPESVGRHMLAPVFGTIGLGAAAALALASSVSVPFGVASIAVAVACGLGAAAASGSRRYFRADAQGLRTGAAPIPGLGGLGVRVPRVRELFVERNWTAVRRGRYRFIWELYARTEKGGRVPILEGAPDPILVHWLGQRLAARLGAKLTPAVDPEGGEGAQP